MELTLTLLTTITEVHRLKTTITDLSLLHGVADGPVPLGRDGDEHVHGGRLEHAPQRVPEVRVAQLVPAGLPADEDADDGALHDHVDDE